MKAPVVDGDGKERGPRRDKFVLRASAIFGALAGIGIAVLVVHERTRRELASPPATRVVSNRIGGSLLSEDEGPLSEVLLHYVPRLEAFIETPYTDFLRTLPSPTRVVLVVPESDPSLPSGTTQRAFSFLDRIAPTLRARTRVVEVPGPISVWSKDRALVTTVSDTKFGLLIPVPPADSWTERKNDWQTLRYVARGFEERYFVTELPLAFDAGDFAITRGHVIVDINLFTKNRSRVASPTELSDKLARWFDRPILTLGAGDGDVPRHHLSMYMTPLGHDGTRPVVLVGDPRRAEAVVGKGFDPKATNPDTDEPLKPDFSEPMVRRFERVAEELAAAGYRVVRIPNIPFDDKTYVAYTNGVYETREGQKTAWVPVYDIPGLDKEAVRIHEELGWRVVPVRVREVYPYHGTIGCLVNVLGRGP